MVYILMLVSMTLILTFDLKMFERLVLVQMATCVTAVDCCYINIYYYIYIYMFVYSSDAAEWLLEIRPQLCQNAVQTRSVPSA